MEPKLKFYVGDITNGGIDGLVTSSIQCAFPRLNVSCSNTMIPFRFALRCDDGYRADNVMITFNGDMPISAATGGYIRCETSNTYKNGWANNHTADISIGTITNKNTVLYLEYNPTYVNPPSYNHDNMEDTILTIYASYSEVKL